MMAQFVMDLGNPLKLRVLHAGIDLTKLIVVESNLVESIGKLHKLQHLKVNGHCTEVRANEAI